MKNTALVAALLAAFSAPAAFAAATTADVVVIMDESGSMSGEQAWMPGTISLLNAGLVANGLSGNGYGLVGFGASSGTAGTDLVRSIPVGGGQFGTPAEFATASAGLVTNGGTEDGYRGMDLASTYTFRAGAARNFILVTDEDRDNTLGSLTFASMLASLTGSNTLLNAVVNANFLCGDSSVALGMTANGTGYKANGSGGFTTCTGATNVSGAGNTEFDYVDLALASGGAAWDLNILRGGGLDAESFTNAFIDVKVQEIITQPPAIPEPETYALMLAGLGAVGWMARRRKQQA
jgi:hypothetical protein